MIESEKCISPIEWDRNSEVILMNGCDQIQHSEVKEIYPICTQSSPQIDAHYRLPAKIKYLFQEARYFMIKSNNFENISLAKVRNVWSTTRANEIRLNKAFYETKNVLLIFSVKESGKFQGYARLSTPSNPKKHITWVLPSHMSQRQLSGVFQIDWLSREDVSFSKTNHLVNAWNEHKPVKIGRDGQEIEPSCGEFLCRLFPVDDDCPFNDIIEKAKFGPNDYRDVRHSSATSDNRSQEQYYGPRLSTANDDQHNYRSDNQNHHSHKRHRRSSSLSKRGREVYSDSSRSRDNNKSDNSDIFLNGNYEDYLREQTRFDRIYNQYSYEQRVDEFLRNIVRRDPDHSNRDDDGSEHSGSTAGRRRRRSRSSDRHPAKPTSRYHSRRRRSRSRHRR